MQGEAVPFIVAFGISAVIVWLTTPVVRSIGVKLGIVDKPSSRKMHKEPVARIGGVSIFLGTASALLLCWWAGWFGILPTAKEYEIWGVTIGGLLFFCIGLADDFFNLPALSRLVLQLLVSSLAWLVGVRIEFITLPFLGIVQLGLLNFPITVLWLAGIANAVNWIDGLDGLAAGVSGIAALVILITSLFMNQPAAGLIAAALSGGCIAFLRYNFKPDRPAEIFMGDGGAYYLGFTLAGISVIGVVKTVATAAVILPYIILAVPLCDALTVIFTRLWKGQSPFVADKRHLHHRLVAAGVSKRHTVLFIYALTLWVGSLALAFSGMTAGGTYAAIGTVIMIYASWRTWRRVHQKQISK
ncbi:MAG: undecaprenyl/decaprenyl-phosphate alpha-N-acetylglucosaminyl 1-phosphate transferase [Cyanobacteria bacterium KgW148]|nr:undecaprenyl/decaprenyl-phosphate alpha-N-acetylglucosaminyl 1-phosphate transferase [Cyanobacteria bacterium KgW148]